MIFVEKKMTLSDQTGSVAILAAFGISAAIASGVYLIGDKITQVDKFEQRLESMAKLSSYNAEAIEQAAQFIQTNKLEINTDSGSISPDSEALKSISAGGNGWRFDDGRTDRVVYSYCRPDLTSPSIQSLLSNNKDSDSCDEAKKVVTKIAVDRIQLVDIRNVDGTTEETAYVVLRSTTSLFVRDEKIERVQKARLKIPPPSPGDCPFTDPNLNPPKKPSPFTVPMFIAVGRAFVGWTKIGIPQNQSRGWGYASVQFDREIFADERCGGHECNYWAPSTASVDIRAWRVLLGGLTFGVQLHTPKHAPGSCFLTFHPNRRPRKSWNSGCFAAGTDIRMADMSTKAVEKIEKGDLVYNPVTRSSSVVARTIAGPEVEPMRRIFTSASSVTVTSIHPFETEGGLKSAKDLVAGDRILSFGGRYDTVQRIESVESRADTFVYNLALENQDGRHSQHMVEADGVVTGDLFLQEKVSGVDPSKRPTDPEIEQFKGLITKLMTKPDLMGTTSE